MCCTRYSRERIQHGFLANLNEVWGTVHWSSSRTKPFQKPTSFHAASLQATSATLLSRQPSPPSSAHRPRPSTSIKGAARRLQPARCSNRGRHMRGPTASVMHEHDPYPSRGGMLHSSLAKVCRRPGPAGLSTDMWSRCSTPTSSSCPARLSPQTSPRNCIHAHISTRCFTAATQHSHGRSLFLASPRA
jgi:hypothetical protein